MILRLHLTPVLGRTRLDAITNEHVQRLKGALRSKALKTVNNILSVLSTLLKTTVEWGVIERMPCSIRLLKVAKSSAEFHDFDTYDRLVEAARTTDEDTYLTILFGGEAGLRLGEMIAVEWTDVDLATRLLCVQRSDWNGQVTSPKNGRLRYVPLTVRLAMRGAPARAIQELAGHADLSTTMRYMHLSPAALEAAIRLLDQPNPVYMRGDIVETGIADR